MSVPLQPYLIVAIYGVKNVGVNLSSIGSVVLEKVEKKRLFVFLRTNR